jgi:hypothetical protein
MTTRSRVQDRRPDFSLWAISIALALVGLGFVAAHVVNVPYWDEWEFTEVIAGTEPFTWSWVWAPHNEHRLVWQKLLAYAWGRLTGWNVAGSALFPALLICAGSLLLIRRELAQHKDLPAGTRRLFVAVLSLWLFSLRQHQNLTWGFGLTWALLFVILIAFSSIWRRFLAEGRGGAFLAALLFLATLNNAAGLALDLYVIGHALVAALRRRLRVRDAALALTAGLLLALYFFPAGGVAQRPLLSNPLQAAAYGLVYAGSSVALLWPLALGFSILSLALFAAALRHRPWADLYEELPLLIIGLLMMAMVVAGRSGPEIQEAAASRYATISLLLQWDLWTFSFATLRSRLSPRALKAGLWAAFILFLGGWSMGLAEATLVVGHRVRALEAFAGCASVASMDLMRCPSEEVFPVQEVLVRRVRILREEGLCFFATR